MVTSGTCVTEGKICLHLAFQSIDYPANRASFAANQRGCPKPDTRCNLDWALPGAGFGHGSRRLSERYGQQIPTNGGVHACMRILDRAVPHYRPGPPGPGLSSSQPGSDDGREKDNAVTNVISSAPLRLGGRNRLRDLRSTLLITSQPDRLQDNPCRASS